MCTACWCLLELMEPELAFLLLLDCFFLLLFMILAAAIVLFCNTNVVPTDLVLGESNDISQHTSH